MGSTDCMYCIHTMSPLVSEEISESCLQVQKTEQLCGIIN